jgi:hypothetical protein
MRALSSWFGRAAVVTVVLSTFLFQADPASAWGRRLYRCYGDRCACFSCSYYGCVRVSGWSYRYGYRRRYGDYWRRPHGGYGYDGAYGYGAGYGYRY